jgi:hypothetical protein
VFELVQNVQMIDETLCLDQVPESVQRSGGGQSSRFQEHRPIFLDKFGPQ